MIDRGKEKSLCGDDADPRRVSKARQELFAVFPGQPKSTYVRDAKAGDNISNGGQILLVKLTLHHGILSPGDKICQREFVAQVGCKLLRNGLASDRLQGC